MKYFIVDNWGGVYGYSKSKAEIESKLDALRHSMTRQEFEHREFMIEEEN